MRIDGLWFDNSTILYDEFDRQLPEKIAAVHSKKVKYLHFYSDFYEKDGSYPFRKGNTFYYPLTLVHYNETWETQWISWTVDMAANEKPLAHPYICSENVDFSRLPFGINYPIEIVVNNNDDVDEAFKAKIKGKTLYYNMRKHFLIACKGLIGVFDYRHGETSQFFINEIAMQVEKQLDALVGVQIPRQDFDLSYFPQTYCKKGDENFALLEITPMFGLNLVSRFAVRWKGDFDTSDWNIPDNVRFTISEYHPEYNNCISTREFKDYIIKYSWHINL